MAYVTVQHLSAALANAGGAGSRTAAELPADRLQANLDEATAEVTGRLRGSFTLPDPGTDPATSPENIPELMRTIIVGIAGYLATLEFYGSQTLEQRDPVVLRYDRARELLAAVAGGRLTVEGLTEVTPGDVTGEAEVFQPHAGLGLASSFDVDQYGRHVAPPYSGGAVWG